MAGRGGGGRGAGTGGEQNKVLKRLVKNFNTFPVNSEISWILF